MDTNASANHIVRKLLRIPLTCLPASAGTKKEKINDAAINPAASNRFVKKNARRVQELEIAVIPCDYGE